MTKSKTHITLTVEEYGALTDRINHLEKTARQDMNILNMLLQMNSIYNENGQIRDKQVVFSSLKEQLHQLITIDVIAFFLVNEEDSNFVLADCSEESEVVNILELKDTLVEKGEFAWALSQNRTVIVDHTDNDKLVLLQTLSTKFRVRGMFMGVIPKTKIPSNKNLHLLSIFSQHVAYSLESIDLYTMINSYNDKLKKNNLQLEKRVEERTQSLKIAIANAEQANQAKSKFLANMSHELRTPLTAIMGFCQLLSTDPDEPLTTSQTESLNYIFEGSQHLLQLMNQLLDLAKIEAGQLELQLEAVDFETIIDECISLIKTLADQENITLHVPEIVTFSVQADYMYLKQILLNLLSNAIKYNQPNGSLTITCQKHSSMLKVSVIDTGIGIPIVRQKKLFTSFSRLGHENSAIEGTGIGLVICKTLIESMHGNMGFESTEGKGSTFWFELPLIKKR